MSSTLYAQDKKVSFSKTSHDERLNNMSTRNNSSTKIETAKIELEETMNTNLDEFKTEIKADNETSLNSVNMKLSYITFKKHLFFLWPTFWWPHSMSTPQETFKIYPCATIYQTPILHYPLKWHTSSNTKIVGRHPFWFLSILFNKQELYGIQITYSRSSLTIFLYYHPDTHTKFYKAKSKYESFCRALRVHLVKDKNIPSYKSPKSHVKLITYLNIGDYFDLIIAVLYSMSPQLGGLVPKAQDVVIYFCLGEGGNLPQFHLKTLQERSEKLYLKMK